MTDTHKVYKLEKFGLEANIGKYAKQANGAVWLKQGKNIVLSTAVASAAPVDFPGYFPLMVEYRERLSAAGKIPGGYIKREGRLSDSEILISLLASGQIGKAPDSGSGNCRFESCLASHLIFRA